MVMTPDPEARLMPTRAKKQGGQPRHDVARPQQRYRPGSIEAAEAALEKERKDARAREARHKLTVERLRRQIRECGGRASP